MNAIRFRLSILLVFIGVHLGGFTQHRTVEPVSQPVFVSVKIGNQVWMAENLGVDRFRNGDLIPQAKSKAAWQKAAKNETPAWCYYGFDAKNGMQYGKLYNQFAVTDARGLAPIGWHIPNFEEWDELGIALGGEALAGNLLKSKTGWDADGNGTDQVGFTALPTGYCSEKGKALYRGKTTSFWTKDEGVDLIFGLIYTLGAYDSKLVEVNQLKVAGLPVRCVKD